MWSKKRIEDIVIDLKARKFYCPRCARLHDNCVCKEHVEDIIQYKIEEPITISNDKIFKKTVKKKKRKKKINHDLVVIDTIVSKFKKDDVIYFCKHRITVPENGEYYVDFCEQENRKFLKLTKTVK